MHASLLENMQKCYERYVCGAYFAEHDHIVVLDIGGTNVNGSFADIFSPEKFDYIAADLGPAEGVDLNLENPYKLDFDHGTVDIVISGQTFENVEFFWLLFQEMARVVKQDGWIFLIAPSGGPVHRYPVDCYRFYPDAYRGLAKYAGLNLVNTYHDPRGPWMDLVGVFSKNIVHDTAPPLLWHSIHEQEVNRYLAARMPVDTNIGSTSPEKECKKGGRLYLSVIEDLHDRLNPSVYVEIGVRKGKSLALSKCPTIAIDPEPDIDPEQFDQVELFRMPSDYFFEHHWPLGAHRRPVDLAFIDGMHLFEFVLRDFMNLEARSSGNTVVVVDDIFPNHPAQARRQRETQLWTGDVWKFLICLREYRPDLKLTMLNTRPTGLLIVTGLDRENRTLVNQYNSIVKECASLSLENYRDLILNRSEAKSSWNSPFRQLRRLFKQNLLP